MGEMGIVIVSGGLDSTTLAYYLAAKYPYGWHHVSFDYGQRHVRELQFAIETAKTMGATHDIVNLQGIGQLLSQSHSVLVDSRTDVPEGHYAEESMRSTVVPNRNAIMLSIATGIAVAENAEFVAAGMHAGDHWIYPDCRPAFIDRFDHAMRLGNEGFWEGNIIAPFLDMSKADIVELGSKLGVPFEETWSCYKGGQYHCGKCGTCVERKEAFALAGVEDPTVYHE